ncbi:Fic/DOC family protein [Legionella sp. CNM-4043-24]|uniref:Fic/DOC family protein n=1 Tax=Legionella sp. CNM-4043-24 TaxID=3421646 RepID=UPI00403AE743
MDNGRYKVPTDEDYEPGSNDSVLKNLLGIKRSEVIEQVEAQELLRIGLELVALYDANYQFLAEDICNIHELWLAGIYAFAGKYRTVMMSKDGFPFANPERIPQLMAVFESNYLQKYTPCNGLSDKELAEAIGIVHVELIIIHPFREGNGRVARLLANLMALQAGKDMLNYAAIDRTINPNGYKNYINSIHEGFCGHYEGIKNIFLELFKDS